ncbi:MAG TPA: glycine cleavage system protein GcvH [Oligoflexia bacterium]|nr:glycine cleavage system protein GcvH [Oligoflexia bacterium]HMR23748.1 glycine cleavage system protein GcvH [Oligoflexia bacterium]
MDFPEDLYYTKEHEWVKLLENESAVLIGITEYAQDKLGDIVHVELPDEEDEVHVNEPFGSIESVKAVSDVYAPVSGHVLENNSALLDSPEAVNDDPYEDGWLVKVEVENMDFVHELMNAEEYAEFIENEED